MHLSSTEKCRLGMSESGSDLLTTETGFSRAVRTVTVHTTSFRLTDFTVVGSHYPQAPYVTIKEATSCTDRLDKKKKFKYRSLTGSWLRQGGLPKPKTTDSAPLPIVTYHSVFTL